MKTIEYTLENFRLNYELPYPLGVENTFLLDIETTGFSPKNSIIYLIGGAYFKDDKWHIIQWFATLPEEEKEILEAFWRFLNNFNNIIHFNGNTFDLPFIQGRTEFWGFLENFDDYEGIDIYKRIYPCRHFLQLPNCKLKSIEAFLGINREDTYSGGELISIYHAYVNSKEEEKERMLLLHNKDDIKGMLEILPILTYCDLFNLPVRTTKVQSNYYTDLNGRKKQELILRLKLITPVPVPVSYHANDCYVSLEGNKGALRVPVYTEELKFFYDNYKEYFYLPMEDMAIHKSVASFVDKNHRTAATKANCYTRKYSSYLPQWDYIMTPFFKREYKSPLLFFELTEEFKTNREAFSRYASHLLQMLGKAH